MPRVAPSSPKDAIAVLKRHFSPGAALAAKVAGMGAIEAEAGGATVTLSNGRRLLDFGSYGVTLLGHRHPAVVTALTREMERVPTATRLLANPTTTAFAVELLKRYDGSLSRIWLGSDGSDAVEASLKLARRRTGRMRILSVEGAFHGKTLGALALTTGPSFRAGLDPLLKEVTHLCPEDPLAVRKEVSRGDVAAVIFEPVLGEGGVRPLDPSILRRWVDDIHAAEGFAISDEVQTGLGRCGMFSPSMSAGLEPDGVLLGKALGGGLMPLSAVVATESLAAPMVADPTWHTCSFGGHPLACAAGLATLATLPEVQPHAQEVGAVLGRGLTVLAENHGDAIKDVRGAGLMWGIELASPGAAGVALIELAHRGLLLSPCLSSDRTLRLLPPMVTSEEQVDQALEILSGTMDYLQPFF
jgi:putrescine aminotransferase